MGTVSTVDTPDMGIDGRVRLTFGLRLTSIGAGFPPLVNKDVGGTAGREFQIYAYAPANNMVAFSTSNVAGTVATDVGLYQPFPVGAADHTFGVEFTPRSTAVVAILNGARTSLTLGAPAGVPNTTAPVQIGHANLPGRVYWAQMEAINRARLIFPGVAGNYLRVPDAANLDITGDVEVVARVGLANWTTIPISGIVNKSNDPITSGQAAYQLRVRETRRLEFGYSTNGSAWVFQLSNVLPTLANDQIIWVRARFDADDGAGNRVVTFDYALDSPTEPATWTSLGTFPTAGAVASLFVGTAPLFIGTDHSSRGTKGRIARVLVRPGIGAAAVLDVSENDAGTMATSTTFLATSGQTVTVNSTTSDSAYLTPTVGTVTTPDPGPVPTQCVWMFKVSGTTGTLASQWTATAGEAGYIVRRDPANGVIWYTIAPTGGSGSAVSKYALMGPTTTFYAIAADQTTGTMRSWHSADGAAWTALAPQSFPPFTVFDATSPLRIGAYPGGATWDGRIYSAECRTGLDPAAGAVLWRFDANDFYGTGTSYVDPRGRTWTLTAAGAITPRVAAIVQPQPNSLIWRFDASEWPALP